jgi:hypothetical protein
MEVIFVLACWIAWPIICANLAGSKGRDVGMAVLGGILFGLFAVIYYAAVPKLERK